jgi:putative tryptophan/tyrosine transport system substrate-binding protein
LDVVVSVVEPLPIFDFDWRNCMNKTFWSRFLDFCSNNRKSKIQNRKWLGLPVLFFCWAGIPQVGYLAPASLSALAARAEAFRQGLRELGYVEGKNIVVEWRSAEGKLDRLPGLAAELVRLKVNVIVTTGPTATRPAKEATSTIPIVMALDIDPVGTGFVASLARPGGNITGLSSLAPEISGKQLELLKEIVPRLSRVAGLWASSNPGTRNS